jgi:hypothetical protein
VVTSSDTSSLQQQNQIIKQKHIKLKKTPEDIEIIIFVGRKYLSLTDNS